MKFFKFIGAYALFICVVALFLVCWCVVASLMGAPPLLVLITVLLVVFGATGYICLEYVRFTRRIARLEKIVREMDELHLLGEVLPRPVNSLEQAYFKVMKIVSRAAVDDVFARRRELEEYLDYVEGWVHEIKTPLTACSLLLAGGGDVKKLKAELRRADNLAEAILYYARLRASGTDVRASRFSVRDAADEAVKEEMELLIAANVGVCTEGDFQAVTDRQALVFCIKQLLVNCAKYCCGRQVKITAADGRLCVQDNGRGISPHELPLIFRRGYVGTAGRESGGGTGMGLYIVANTCKKCGITLTADSEEGAYTRFTFTFAGGAAGADKGAQTTM